MARELTAGPKIATAGTAAFVKAVKCGLVRSIAGATSPSDVEVCIEQHSFGPCAGCHGHSFEQHSTARALAIAAKHEAAPPLSNSARATKIVAKRRISYSAIQILCRSSRLGKAKWYQRISLTLRVASVRPCTSAVAATKASIDPSVRPIFCLSAMTTPHVEAMAGRYHTLPDDVAVTWETECQRNPLEEERGRQGVRGQ